MAISFLFFFFIFFQVVWAYRYWNVKSNLLSLKEMIKQKFYSKVNELKRTLTDLDINTIVFAPKRGEIVIEFRFAAAMQVYKSVASIVETVEELQLITKKFHKMLPKSNTTFWDIYYMLKPASEMTKWFLPSTGL